MFIIKGLFTQVKVEAGRCDMDLPAGVGGREPKPRLTLSDSGPHSRNFKLRAYAVLL